MAETLADVFNSDLFSLRELTRAINLIPNMYGRIGELKLFGTGRGVATTSVIIERNKNVLNLLPSGTRGADGTKGVQGSRDALSFAIPYIPHDDVVKAADVIGVRQFGSTNQMESVARKVNDKLITMRNKHAITLEWLRAGALRGVVLDADGTRVLLNLFSEFGITEKVVAFDLANDTADIPGKINEVLRYIEDNLEGDVMKYVHALCSPEFFDAFTTHPKVEEAYKFYTSTQNPLREDVRKRFEHKGIVWEEYRGQATSLQPDGTKIARRFIPAGDVRFFPMGTQETFDTVYAPADFIETVNTEGVELYAKQVVEKFGRWVDIHTQSSPLPFCMRPAVLVRGHRNAP
ncbi:major capsid protein [Vineibacter terrae]|uniref:major capsid protein n=1 Tax=Vineibacter terrae TaxID=2586908 RepID=UPI002E2FA7DE|nr:major capsid protein [Vineibacter terrae]HEX2888357.1 major capsid protein [Vineibacter terrae]